MFVRLCVCAFVRLCVCAFWCVFVRCVCVCVTHKVPLVAFLQAITFEHALDAVNKFRRDAYEHVKKRFMHADGDGWVVMVGSKRG